MSSIKVAPLSKQHNFVLPQDKVYSFIFPKGGKMVTEDTLRTVITSTVDSTFITDALGYTPENVSNKSTTMTGNEGSDDIYLSSKAVNDWITAGVVTDSVRVTTSITASYATASTIAIFDASKNLVTASTATYPSLTELSYVKGVTSAIQTQINAKQSTNANLTSLSALTYTSRAFVYMNASGTFSLDTSTYISGNQTITLSGDVTGSGATAITTTIASGSVSLAKMANLAANSIIGNNTGSSATPLALTGAQVLTLIAASPLAGSSSIVTLGTVTTGTLSTGVVIGGVTMTLGSDASYDIYYRNSSGVLTRLANGTTGQVLTATTGGAPSWGAGGSGSSAFSALTVASASNTINNANYAQEWQWNTLDSITGLKLSSTSTAAASNTQTLFAIALSGANGTSTQTTYGATISNTHTGTSSTNVALSLTASGGTNNYALLATGFVGIYQTTPTSRLHLNYNQNSVTQSDANGLLLANSTAAINGTQSISPAIVLQGNAYSTGSSISVDARVRIDVLPVQTSAGYAKFQVATSVAGGAYTSLFTSDTVNGMQILTQATITGNLSCSGGFYTGTTSTNGNIFVWAGSSMSSTNSSTYTFASAANTFIRTSFGSNTNTTLTADYSCANVVFSAGNTITEAGSGTHAMIANVVMKGQTIANGAGATTNAATLYIEGAPSGITPTGGLYSLMVGAGNTLLQAGTLTDGTSALTVTATMPSVITAANHAIDFQITSAGSSAQSPRAFRVNLLAGYTGSAATIVQIMTNSAAGTSTLDPFGLSTTAGNRGFQASANSSTSGTNIGGFNQARNSTGINIGSFSYVDQIGANSTNYGAIGNVIVAASGTSNNIGIAGIALNGSVNIGGYFGLQTTTPTYASAALMCDNGSQTSDIFVCRDNGTSVFKVKDAGNIILGAESALSTSATDGFTYDRTCAGAPSGTPTAYTGMAARVVDTTNNKVWYYVGGAWKYILLT